MRKSIAASLAAFFLLTAPALAQTGITQTARSGCLSTPSATITLSGAVAAGDDLMLVVSGDGYIGAAATVTGVSDNVNGAWAPLVNDKSLAASDGTSYLSYSVWHRVNSKAATSGLTVTVNETAGQTQAAAVVLDLAGPVSEDQEVFRTAMQPPSTILTSPAVNASANELAVGVFAPWTDGQTLSVGSGWSLDTKAQNCSAAFAESQIVPKSGSLTATMTSSMIEFSLSGLMTFRQGTPPPPPPTPAPTNTDPPAISGTPQVGAAVTTSNGTWNNRPTSYLHAWEDCDSTGAACSLISGATSSSYTLQSRDAGYMLRSLVTATNAGGSSSAYSARAAVTTAPLSPSPPANTALPAISGATQEGQTLSASNGAWTNSPTSGSYQWQDCTLFGCSTISGATAQTYTVQPADVGDTIDVTVTATNAAGSGTATSAQTAPIAATPVSPSGGPSVTVTNTAGATLSTQLSTNNVWSGVLDQAPNGQSEFNALHAPLVRLHVGDDGGSAEAMPEIKQGQWSFATLDPLVNDVFATGQKPMMNIKFAPDFMWTCYPNSIGVGGTQGTGSVADLTFKTFAQYMARIVSYYNKGTMTTESGQVMTNPAGISHAIQYWELWNEPDLNIETPCAPSNGYGITPAQYLTMWDAVTAAMVQVDPTLKFVGPATAGAQFGSSTMTGNQYVDELMAGAVTKPAAISFHGYGYWDNTVTDQWIFNGDNSDPTDHCCGGITDLVNGVTAIRRQYPNTSVWLTEVNVNADWGNDTYKRPSSEFGAAWWGAAFAELAPLGVGLINEYDLVDSRQFGLIDASSGKPYIAYYVTQLLDQAFPPGSTLLSSSSSDSGILSLAVKKPDGTISVVVVNRKIASSTVKSSCGTGGVAETVNVSLPVRPRALSLEQIDKTNVNCSTNGAIAPTTQNLGPAQTVTLKFPGYGIAVLNVKG